MSVKTQWLDPMPGIKNAARRGMTEILGRTTSEAKSLATGFTDPTGRTLNSISYQIEKESGGFNQGGGKTKALASDQIKEPTGKLVGYVGTNVYYAAWVENGTDKTRAHPFIAPAVEIHAKGRSVIDTMRRWEQIRANGSGVQVF